MSFKDILAKILYYPIKYKNILDIKRLYKSYEINNKKLDLIDMKPLGKTLVIIPHVDDETIGLGGLLVKNKQDNEKVDFIYMTDSGGSLKKGSENTKLIRKNEAFNLAKELKINKIETLDVENNNVEKFTDYAIEKLSNKISKVNYKNLFIVSPFDAHPEHRWVNKVLYKVLKKSNFKGDIYLYEVSNLLPNSLINSYCKIDLNEKNKLYNIFESQKKAMDFNVFSKLNKYKGLSINENEPIEFYTKLSTKEYIKLLEIF